MEQWIKGVHGGWVLQGKKEDLEINPLHLWFDWCCTEGERNGGMDRETW